MPFLVYQLDEVVASYFHTTLLGLNELLPVTGWRAFCPQGLTRFLQKPLHPGFPPLHNETVIKKPRNR